MSFVVGKDAVVKMDNGAGVLTDVSQYATSVDPKLSADAQKTTTLGKNSNTYVPGLKDGTLSLEFNRDDAIDQILWDAYGAIRSYEVGPEGGASGATKYSFEGIVTGFSPGSISPDGVVTQSADVQITGDVTRSTFA